jgi:multicomponent Na+:H+ antiporter subunit E
VLQIVALTISLILFWIALSGYWIPLILALGAASIAFSVYIAHRMDVCDEEGHPIHVALRGIGYFPWLTKEIVVSNIAVAKAILAGNVRPQVLQVHATQSDELGQVVYANSITLTPGTVTIAEANGLFTVHALMDDTADGLKSGDMNDRVCMLMDGKRAPGAVQS